MPDSIPAASAVISPGSVTAIPEVITPAVPTPKPTIANPDVILANIKARIAGANKEPAKPAEGTAPVQPSSAAGAGTPTGTVPDIQPDAKTALAELAKAHAKNREWAEKVKLLEATAADAEFGKSIKGAKTPKDQLEAVAKLAGKDPTEYLADLVSMYFEQPGGLPGTDPAKAAAAPSGDIKAVLDRLEAMSKELADIKGGKAQETEQAVKAREAEQEQSTKAYLKSIAAKHKDKFEISSRPENLDEAVAKAIAKAPEAVAALGLDPAELGKLSEEQAEALASKAMELAEQEFEQLGKRFGKVAVPERTRAYDIPLSKPRIDFGTKPEKETFEQLKDRYRAKYDSLFGPGATYQSAPNGKVAGIAK